MQEIKINSQLDIILILILTFFAIALNIPNIVSDDNFKNLFSILFLFLPGYSILITIHPENKIGNLKKIVYSILISIIFLILILIIENVSPNLMIILGPNLIMILSLITLIFAISAYIRRYNFEKNLLKNQITCKRCKKNYILEENESLADLKSCNCGGILYYKEHITESHKRVPWKEFFDTYFDLIFVIVITVISIPIIILTINNSIKIFLGVLLTFFLPGYSLISFYFQKKGAYQIMKKYYLVLVLVWF